MSYEDDILIERFLRDELSEKERTLFLERMKEDFYFKEKVALEEQLFNLLNDQSWSFADDKDHPEVKKYEEILNTSETQQIRSSIARAGQEYKRNNTNSNKIDSSKKVINMRWILGLAASLIIILSIIKYLTPEKINYKFLVNKAWKKNIGLDLVLRNNSADMDRELLIKALNNYNAKRYSKVLMLLKNYDSASNSFKDVLLLRSLSKYRLNQSEVALKTLDTLAQYSPDISRWYKGLISLEMNDLEKASLYLEIPSSANRELKLK